MYFKLIICLDFISNISDLLHWVRCLRGWDFQNCIISTAFFSCFTNVGFTWHLFCLLILLNLTRSSHKSMTLPPHRLKWHILGRQNDASSFLEVNRIPQKHLLWEFFILSIPNTILGSSNLPNESVLSPIPVQQRICNDRHYLLRLHILAETLDKSIF